MRSTLQRTVLLLAVPIIGYPIVACDDISPSNGTQRIKIQGDSAVAFRGGIDKAIKEWELVEGTWQGRGNGIRQL